MRGNNDRQPKKSSSGVKEIARRANVSIGTVDRVLHNRSGVAPYTKRIIERIIKDLDYKPNIIASRLASQKKYNFAIFIPSVSEENDFWQAPLNGITRAGDMVKEYGISLDFYFFDLNDKKTFERNAESIIENKPDGVLLAPSFIGEAGKFVAGCTEKNIPYVLIDSDIEDQTGLSYIGPNLIKSGRLGAQIIQLAGLQKEKVLIVNIAKEIDYHHYLKEIEKGFYNYFEADRIKAEIKSMEVRKADYRSVSLSLNKIYKTDFKPSVIFVTNSRVNMVARYLEEKLLSDVFLLGFDYIKKNIEYLKKGIIKILICHKSEEQGYRGVMTLYRHLLLKEPVEPCNFMPMDIITKENYEFYHN